MCLEVTERTVYLLRHAQSEANIGKFSQNNFAIHLTQKGRKTAASLAFGLEFRPQVILTSPLTTAVETAEIIRRHFPAVKFEIHDKLRELEYAAAGEKQEWIAKTRSFLTSRSPFWRDRSDTETVADLFDRANEMISMIHALPEDPILVVSHELFIQSVIAVVHNKNVGVEEMGNFFFARLKNTKIANLDLVEIRI
jgi:broad specificity phosphatase PhoE